MTCRELRLASFNKVYKWIKQQNGIEMNAVNINYGRRNGHFRAWAFAGDLLLMSNENAANQVQYVLSKDKWSKFLDYVQKNPDMKVSELAHNCPEYGCTSKVFWPSIIHICNAYFNEINSQ